jgi:uncharacterized damage-inducible protein DinB
MRLRTVLTACWLLALAAVAPAQLPTQVADPVSGTWAALIGPGAVPDYPVTMDLKLDGTGAVTGSAKGGNGETATIRGTFDPKTAALKMVAQISGDSNLMTFEGTLVTDTATGRLTPSNRPTTGVFVLRKQAVAGASATQPGAPDAAAPVRNGFTEVSGWVTKAADLVPADKYTYQPVKTVRTFGQLVGHVADAYNFYCGRAAGKNVQWSDEIANGKTDKATVVARLKQSLEGCNAAYASPGRIDQLMANVAHTNLHYGNIVTYMRMLGLVPPSS